MGPCTSAEQTGDVSESWDAQEREIDGERCRVDKKTGEAVDNLESRPDTNFMDFEFEAEEVKEGQEFLSVKPWKAVERIKPTCEDVYPEEVDKSQPDFELKLEYVYGYQCQNARQNVYYNSDGNIVYHCAALGIVLDKETNTQQFFGGGIVPTEDKKVASNAEHHNNDITCLNVNVGGMRNMACSGQDGPNPAIFTWDTSYPEVFWRGQLNRNSRKVSAIAFSGQPVDEEACWCRYLATADRSNDNVITVWHPNEDKKMLEIKSGPDAIWDLAFNKMNDTQLWAVGVKCCWYIDLNEGDKKRGIFGDHPRCSFSCVTGDNDGNAYSGSTRGNVYVWSGNQIKTTYDFHDSSKGFVGALMWLDGKLYSGGSDCCVKVVNTETGECEKSFTYNSLPRGIDVFDGKLLVGLRGGFIVETDMQEEDVESQTKYYVYGHNSGETWGLAVWNEETGGKVYSTGDDNKVMCWDIDDRINTGCYKITDKKRKAKRNRASRRNHYADSQCARCVAFDPQNAHVAIGCNDGSVLIKHRDCLDEEPIAEITDSKEWVEVAEYTIDGKYLAIGSHDTNIYVYDVANDYKLHGKCTKHNATVTSVDFTLDGSYIRSVCNGYEVLFFTVENCEQDPNGATNTADMVWATHHAKFGWLVSGIFPKETSGDHINGVSMSQDSKLIATADDFGLVNIFRCPARKGVKPKSYRGHSEHVVRVVWGQDKYENYLFSVGGYDQAVMQWKSSDLFADADAGEEGEEQGEEEAQE